MVFIDTPGIHKPMHRMNRRMVDAALDTLREVDVIVLVVDATARPGAGDEFVVGLLERAHGPVVLALNKVGSASTSRACCRSSSSYAQGVRISRDRADLRAHGRRRATRSSRRSWRRCRKGSRSIPTTTSPTRRERRSPPSSIREQVLAETHDELPYTTAVVIDQFEEPSGGKAITRIFASILVDQDSQKPIVVGKGGEKIKKIGTAARQDLEQMLDGKVYLDLHVKVRTDWRDDERMLDELGLGRK